jgi:hypothetical protein
MCEIQPTYCQLPPLPLIAGQGRDNFAPFSAERLYTTDEAASYLKVGPRALAKFITGDRPNKLKASWVDRHWLIAESSLRNFITENERDHSQLK